LAVAVEVHGRHFVPLDVTDAGHGPEGGIHGGLEGAAAVAQQDTHRRGDAGRAVGGNQVEVAVAVEVPHGHDAGGRAGRVADRRKEGGDGPLFQDLEEELGTEQAGTVSPFDHGLTTGGEKHGEDPFGYTDYAVPGRR